MAQGRQDDGDDIQQRLRTSAKILDSRLERRMKGVDIRAGQGTVIDQLRCWEKGGDRAGNYSRAASATH